MFGYHLMSQEDCNNYELLYDRYLQIKQENEDLRHQMMDAKWIPWDYLSIAELVELQERAKKELDKRRNVTVKNISYQLTSGIQMDDENKPMFQNMLEQLKTTYPEAFEEGGE